MGFVYAAFQVHIFFLHHSLPLVRLWNPSGFSLLLLSCPSAIAVSLPFSHSSCCLFFPLAILLIVFFYPLDPLCVFALGLFSLSGFSPLHPSQCPYFHFLPSRCQEVEVFLVAWSPFLLMAVSLEEGTCSLEGEKLLSFQLSCDKKQRKKSQGGSVLQSRCLLP